MAFKNAGVELTTSAQVLYTCPALKEAVVHTCSTSNIHATNQGKVTIEATVDGGTTWRFVAKSVPVPVECTAVYPKPINLEAGDKIRLTADANSTLDCFLSILEEDI